MGVSFLLWWLTGPMMRTRRRPPCSRWWGDESIRPSRWASGRPFASVAGSLFFSLSFFFRFGALFFFSLSLSLSLLFSFVFFFNFFTFFFKKTFYFFSSSILSFGLRLHRCGRKNHRIRLGLGFSFLFGQLRTLPFNTVLGQCEIFR